MATESLFSPVIACSYTVLFPFPLSLSFLLIRNRASRWHRISGISLTTLRICIRSALSLHLSREYKLSTLSLCPYPMWLKCPNLRVKIRLACFIILHSLTKYGLHTWKTYSNCGLKNASNNDRRTSGPQYSTVLKSWHGAHSASLTAFWHYGLSLKSTLINIPRSLACLFCSTTTWYQADHVVRGIVFSFHESLTFVVFNLPLTGKLYPDHYGRLCCFPSLIVWCRQQTRDTAFPIDWLRL